MSSQSARIIFHTDCPPKSSVHFQTVKKLAKQNFEIQHVKQPVRVWDRGLGKAVHVSDVYRLLVLLKFGGIYCDGDMVLLKSHKRFLNSSLPVVGEESPASLANGFMMSPRKSRIFLRWLLEYKFYQNILMGPYGGMKIWALWRKYPGEIHVEHGTMVRPNWKELSLIYKESFDCRGVKYCLFCLSCLGWKLPKMRHFCLGWNTKPRLGFSQLYAPDGGKSEKLLKWDQKETSLKKSPGFIESVAYMAYYGAVLIGPQFTLSHYRNFIDGKYIKKCKETFFAETRKLAIQKLVLGVALVGLYGVVGPMLSVEHLKENAFFERSLPSRIGYIYIMGWLQFYKYLSMWLISEGALILAGVGTVETKNRKTQELVLDHSQCENVKVGLITTCNVMLEFVDGFNINTNKWVMNYCFKRLAFLGNKNVSQLASLAFLALWHGFNFGYFTCFFYEFMTIFAEKELLARGILVRGYKGNKFRAILQKFVQVHTIGAYCMIDFNLLEWQAFWPVWKSVFFYGHLLVVFEILLVFMLPKNKVQKKE